VSGELKSPKVIPSVEVPTANNESGALARHIGSAFALLSRQSSSRAYIPASYREVYSNTDAQASS
jgi:hypothetical protein